MFLKLAGEFIDERLTPSVAKMRTMSVSEVITNTTNEKKINAVLPLL